MLTCVRWASLCTIQAHYQKFRTYLEAWIVMYTSCNYFKICTLIVSNMYKNCTVTDAGCVLRVQTYQWPMPMASNTPTFPNSQPTTNRGVIAASSRHHSQEFAICKVKWNTLFLALIHCWDSVPSTYSTLIALENVPTSRKRTYITDLALKTYLHFVLKTYLVGFQLLLYVQQCS